MCLTSVISYSGESKKSSYTCISKHLINYFREYNLPIRKMVAYLHYVISFLSDIKNNFMITWDILQAT